MKAVIKFIMDTKKLMHSIKSDKTKKSVDYQIQGIKNCIAGVTQV